ncbi:MAG: Uma2 family endonuclease [Cyanobacteria bacterium P01_G01_bin.38]
MVQKLPIEAVPNLADLVIEDDEPVDNLPSEKQQRLLIDPLYASKPIPSPFLAAANVGLFYAVKQPAIVPDVFVSLGVSMPVDWSQKKNRAYFFWELGKPPEVVIEIVSNRKGGELDSKLADYARIGVTYYVVFDPFGQLVQEMADTSLKVFALAYGRYVPLDTHWLETLSLGLTLWQGDFEEASGVWLRWCDRSGQII